jgi:hypothetical protein
MFDPETYSWVAVYDYGMPCHCSYVLHEATEAVSQSSGGSRGQTASCHLAEAVAICA